MKRLVLILLSLTALVGAAAVGAQLGWQKGRESTLRAIYVDLGQASLNSARAPEATAQLREYAKAQFYFSADKTPGIYVDLGPVDLKQISGLEPFLLHADSPNDYYRGARQ